jgi:acyl-coenzyme A thioesterase 13
MSDIPAGFRKVERTRPNPFNELVGPFYIRTQGEDVSLGLHIEERHTNSRGICHGGFLATMADLALGYACALQGRQTSFVTINLSLDYAGSAVPGDWVQSKVEVQKTGSRIAFANCYLMANDVRLVRASAVFAMAGKPKTGE